MAATGPPVQTPWLVGLCSVMFDVDVGQTVQHVVPEGAFTTDEESAISFCSFPDSLSMELCLKNSIRDSSFHFRVPCTSRDVSGSVQGTAEGATQQEDTQSAAAAVPHFLYGYVFCRQRQDESLRRGGEQSSLVVVSRAPLSSVLAPLAQVAGPLFFSQGPQALQQVFEEVCSWPPPVPGASMSLPLAGTTITARLPSFLLLPPPQPPVDPEVQLHLARRSSSKGLARWHSLTSTSSLSTMGSAGLTQEQLAPAAEAAAAAPGQPPAEQPPSPTKQQQQPQRASTGGEAVDASGSGSSPSSHAASANGSSTATAGPQSGGMPPAADATAVATPLSPARRRPPPASEAEELALTAPHAELPTYTTFASLLRHMWHLWELLLLGHPLMVVGPSPRDCSTAVSCLLALITPLPYSADFRPYFTIHDSAFLGIQAYFLKQQQQQQVASDAAAAAAGAGRAAKQSVEPVEDQEEASQAEEVAAEEGQPQDPDAQQQPPASQQQHQQQLWELGLPVLLGLTNLYLLRALPQWRTVLSVGNKEAAMSRSGAAAAAASATSSSGTGYFSGALRALRRRSQGTQSLLSDYSQNLWAAPKALTRPDHRLIANWAALACEPGSGSSSGGGAAAGGGPQVAGKAMRRHFAELTLAVLAPFKKYLQPADDGMVTRWCPSAFLAEVALPGAVDPLLQQRLVGGGSAATLTTFYSRLLAGPHWRPWFEAKVASVAHLVRPEPKVVTLSMDGRDDIALVEAFVALELALQEAAAANAATSLPEDTSSDLQLREASALGLAAAAPAAAAAASSGTGDGGGGGQDRAGASAGEAGAGPAAMRRASQSAPDLTSTEQGAASSNGPVSQHAPAVKSDAMRRLEQQLVDSFFAMSLDLKQTMVSTPARLALLMSLVEKEEHHEELQQLVAGLA